MEPFFPGPDVERLPPEKTRITALKAVPDSSGQRLRLTLDVTPFQKRPNLELILRDSTGQELSSASIIEPVGWKLELTLHLRKQPAPDAASLLTLHASLTYPDLGEVDRRDISLSLHDQ